MMGVCDDELATRWVQFGVFSPINRLHSTLDPFNSKEPWNFSQEACETMEDFLRLRHALVPYLYTMNRLASREGQPLMRPALLGRARKPRRLRIPECVLFRHGASVRAGDRKARPRLVDGARGDVAAGRRVGRLRDPDAATRAAAAWNCGARSRKCRCSRTRGAIVPMQDRATLSNALENPAALEVFVFTGADGAFTLWEDAGDTPEDRDENWGVHRAAPDGRRTVRHRAGRGECVRAAQNAQLARPFLRG